jgi:galactose mutarotase-like enzyme
MDDTYFDRTRIEQRTASVAQLASAREVVIDNGPGRGVRVVEIDNGTGLRLEVLVDRGLDLGSCTFRGVPVTFATPSGVTHPAYYDPRGANWLRTWGGGLLTGAGMRNVGHPQKGDQTDDPQGLHGRLSHIPATLTGVHSAWEKERFVTTVSGTVRESSFFGDNLRLERTIRVESVANSVEVTDMITNDGPRETPFMMLYHCNFGYPVLDDDAQVVCNSDTVDPRDDEAAAHMDDWTEMDTPTDGYQERCYFPDVRAENGRSRIALDNPKMSFIPVVEWRKRELPHITVWKTLGTKEYALGLEPANCHPDGRRNERDRGTLVTLNPGESREHSVKITFEERG